MKRALFLVVILVCVGACQKKGETVATASSASASVAAASASAAPVASAAASAADSAQAAATSTAPPPPPGMPGISDDPNETHAHADHDKAATDKIQKANYKSELDALEKEMK